jgi:hypothetical protein
MVQVSRSCVVLGGNGYSEYRCESLARAKQSTPKAEQSVVILQCGRTRLLAFGNREGPSWNPVASPGLPTFSANWVLLVEVAISRIETNQDGTRIGMNRRLFLVTCIISLKHEDWSMSVILTVSVRIDYSSSWCKLMDLWCCRETWVGKDKESTSKKMLM